MLSGHLQSVPCIRWGGEGLIYSASQDRTIKVWRDEDVSVLVRLMLLLNDLKVSSQEARNVVIVVFQIGNWWSRSYLENACCKKKKKDVPSLNIRKYFHKKSAVLLTPPCLPSQTFYSFRISTWFFEPVQMRKTFSKWPNVLQHIFSTTILLLKSRFSPYV